jgi:hypothetical protein
MDIAAFQFAQLISCQSVQSFSTIVNLFGYLTFITGDNTPVLKYYKEFSGKLFAK